MQLVPGHPTGARVVVDYAHTPDALESALKALRPETRGRLAVVFGAGGDRDAGKRPMMGSTAHQHADIVYVTDDNPRSEDASAIRTAIIESCPNAIEIPDRGDAIASAMRDLDADDVLLIAGKGHESVQLVGNETLALQRFQRGQKCHPQADSRWRLRMSAATPSMLIDAAELARRVEGTWLTPPGEVTVTAVEIDSRLCAPGTLFVALPGQNADGHDYITAASANGAAAALASRDPGTLPHSITCPLLRVDDVEAALARLGAFGRAAHRLAGGHLVAITGSVGKTGSKEMLAHMLRRLGGCHANRASFNNHLGVPLTLAALPDAPLAAVQEIGMNAPGEIRTLSALAQPDIAVITRIADSHAGFFDSLDDIAAAKAEIFDGLTGRRHRHPERR
jgi:UDP-N-acetylmuramyl tripeptide synthase